MIIKVCGMREPENIRAVEALGIDLMGFIFWPRSSRYVGEKPSYLPRNCRRVGVFVDAALPDILTAVEDFRLDGVQLHGHETPDAISALKAHIPGVRIVKSLAVAGPEDLAQAEAVIDDGISVTAESPEGSDKDGNVVVKTLTYNESKIFANGAASKGKIGVGAVCGARQVWLDIPD